MLQPGAAPAYGSRDAGPRLAQVFTEARDLGISIVLLAGGEPLVRLEILDLAVSIPEIIFPVFTNGILIDDALVSRLATAHNICRC